jgi:hypothetical protein
MKKTGLRKIIAHYVLPFGHEDTNADAATDPDAGFLSVAVANA